MAVTLNLLTDRTLQHISALEVTKKHEKMKTERPYETLTSIYQVTRRHVPEKKPTDTDDRNAKTREDHQVIKMRAYCEMVVLYLKVLIQQTEESEKKIRHNI
jgi:hypothetical protein